MNSWVGLFLLGNMLGDDAMTAAGAMGYSTESAAVNEYWQDIYRTNLPASYGEGGVGILGSGGVSYATYFDGDPAWVYAIQWVPENHWNNLSRAQPHFLQLAIEQYVERARDRQPVWDQWLYLGGFQQRRCPGRLSGKLHSRVSVAVRRR
jgi:endoglucanase Acf2